MEILKFELTYFDTFLSQFTTQTSTCTIYRFPENIENYEAILSQLELDISIADNLKHSGRDIDIDVQINRIMAANAMSHAYKKREQ